MTYVMIEPLHLRRLGYIAIAIFGNASDQNTAIFMALKSIMDLAIDIF